MRTRLALGLYRCLLAFYPKGFRTEFAAEMKAVFARALGDPRASTACLLWRELRDWPGVVWCAHRAERMKTMTQTGSLPVRDVPSGQPVARGTRRDAWLAILGHLFYLWWAISGVILSGMGGLFHLSIKTQGRLTGSIGGAILFIDLIVVLLCWRGGWPRWGFPYLGTVLTMVAFFAQAVIRNDGSLLFFIPTVVFFIILLVAALSRWWKGLYSLYERLNSDWTLIGLTYFSCLPFTFFIIIDETRYEYRADLVLSLILALGVFLYMRSASPWQRGMVLPVAFILASLVATYYLKTYDIYWQPFFESGTFDMLTIMLLLAIAPLLVVGLFELGRYAFNRWLQAA